MHVERLDLSEWGDHLPATGTEVFHRPAVLRALDDHTDADLVLYGGFKGDQRIALWPVFVRDTPVATAAFSPVPSMGIPRLGPVLTPASPKRRKREQLNRTFVGEVLDELTEDTTPSLLWLACNTGYTDPRPFDWRDLSVTPRFTYHLDVGGDADAQLKSFSRSLRREVRDAEDLDISVRLEGRNGVREIYRETMERYAEQDDDYRVPWSYVRDLTAGLDERARAYVARDPQGTFLGGITVLYSDDAAYFWQGGTRATYESVSVNSLLHWRIVEDIAAGEPVESVDTYDLMGANTERLCEYKAKFGGELVPYFTVESDNTLMDLAKRVYSAVAH